MIMIYLKPNLTEIMYVLVTLGIDKVYIVTVHYFIKLLPDIPDLCCHILSL